MHLCSYKVPTRFHCLHGDDVVFGGVLLSDVLGESFDGQIVRLSCPTRKGDLFGRGSNELGDVLA